MTAPEGLVDAVVEAALGADSPESLAATVRTYGPRLMRERSLMEAVRARVATLAAAGRDVDADKLSRWCDDIDRSIAGQRVLDALMVADGPAEVDALLRQHPEMDWPVAVERGLAEVHSLINGSSPYPPPVALRLAGLLLATLTQIAEFLGSGELRNRCLAERAMVNFMTEDFAAALRDFTDVSAFWVSVGEHFEAARATSLAGDVLRDLDRKAEALAAYRRAVRLLAGSGKGDWLLGATHEDIARLLLERGDEEGALEHLELAMRHRAAAGQVERMAAALPMLIGLRIRRREPDRALEPVERLVEIWPEHPVVDGGELGELVLSCAASVVSGTFGEAGYLRDLRSGDDRAEYQAYVDPERLVDARRWLSAAERALRFAPDERREAMLGYLDAVVCTATGELDHAVERAERALRYYAGHQEPEMVDSLLAVLIEAESERGRSEAAVRWCDEALARPGDEYHRATLLVSRAACLSDLGRTGEALTDLNEAVRLARATQGTLARVTEGAALSALAKAYEALGDVRAAIEAARDALRLARSVGHKRGEAAQLSALGVLVGKLATGWLRVGLSVADRATLLGALYQADPSLTRRAGGLTLEAAAQALLEHAGRLYQEIHDDAGWSVVMLNLCNLIPASEAARKREILTDVVARKEAVGDLSGKAVALANLAAAHRALGDDAAAAQALERSLEISRGSGFVESATQSLVSLARLRRDCGDPAGAEAAFAEAVGMIEAARVQVPLADRYRVGFAHNKGAAYAGLVDLLAERGAYDEAFAVVQQAKSRALLEIAAMADVHPSRPVEGRFAELLARESACLAQLRAAQRATAGMAGEPSVAPPADFAGLNDIYDEMVAYDPEYVSMRRGTPTGLAELRAWLAAQGRPVLLVEYFLSDDQLTVFLFRPEWTHVTAYRRPFTLEQLRTGYADFRRQVVRYRNAAGAGWTAVAQILTEPLARHLRPGDLVYLVPHRLLHGVPLHALPVNGSPLIVEHPVAYAPASGLLPMSQNAAKGSGTLDSCVSFGAVFIEEAQQVAELFGTQAVDPAQLSSDDIEELCADKDVCHFSCHGRFNQEYPLASGLELRPAPEHDQPMSDVAGLLTARQIMHLRLRSELVCLSACETAMSEVGEGDELLGLIRAFLYAGASSVVASLWAVDAETTRTMMMAFYRYLRQAWIDTGRIDKAEALRQAQLHVIAQVGARSSFYWAPFVLIGDWR